MYESLTKFTARLQHSVYESDGFIIVHPRGLPPSWKESNLTTERQREGLEAAAAIYTQHLAITDENVLKIYRARFGDGCVRPTIGVAMVLWLNQDLTLHKAFHCY